jgi:hypothetical protein
MGMPALGDVAAAIAAGLVFCLGEQPPKKSRIEQHERLPLSRARDEGVIRKGHSVREFLRHAFETWILAQHFTGRQGAALQMRARRSECSYGSRYPRRRRMGLGSGRDAR